MRITNFTPNYALTNNRKPNIKFTGEDFNDSRKTDREQPKTLLTGCIIGMEISALFALFVDIINTGKPKDFVDKVNELCNSDELQKDTFTVKDITKDDKPDMILYKKDGTKVVLDIYNNKILQEKNTTILEDAE